MLRPYQMSSVIITGPKNVQEKVIKELHNLKILHIVEHSKNDLADIGDPLESASKLSELLVKVRALIAALNIKKEENKFELKKGLLEVESTIKKLGEEANTNLDKLKKLEGLISRNEAVKQELEILKNIDIPLESFTSYTSLTYFTGYIKGDALDLKEELSKVTKKFMLFGSISKKRSFVVLFIDAQDKEQASSILQKKGFFPVNFVNITNFKGIALSNLKKLEEENSIFYTKREEIKKKLER